MYNSSVAIGNMCVIDLKDDKHYFTYCDQKGQNGSFV